MVLTDKDILAEQDKSGKLISLFDEKKLGGTSYDLTLGSSVRELSAAAGVVYLSHQSEIDSLYRERNISNGYILKPGQYVLCSVFETVSLPDDVIARIMPRTCFTRMGLLVANQFCNASYEGQLQLGLHNVSPNNISLAEGLSIAQIVFERLEEAPSDERLYRNDARAAYQGENSSDFRGATFGGEELSDRVKAILDELTAD